MCSQFAVTDVVAVGTQDEGALGSIAVARDIVVA